jgi:hypothetical protein
VFIIVLTSIVLLLLVVIAKLPLSLRSNPPLCLHHLVGVILTALMSLGSVEVLQI